MSVDLSVTDLAIAGKQRKTQEKKLLVKDQIYCINSTVGKSRQTQEKLYFAFGTQRPLVRIPHRPLISSDYYRKLH
jgi:hypothetical protein